MENVDVAQLVPVERYRIETGTGDSGGYTMPVIQFADRRAAGRPSLKWVYQRHVEIVLFDRGDGGRCPPPCTTDAARPGTPRVTHPFLARPPLPSPQLWCDLEAAQSDWSRVVGDAHRQEERRRHAARHTE